MAGLAALGFLGTAALHSTGYDSIVHAAKNVPGFLGQVMPALWLAFSLDLTVLGLIVGILAHRPADVGRPIPVIAALCPLAAAGLQLEVHWPYPSDRSAHRLGGSYVGQRGDVVAAFRSDENRSGTKGVGVILGMADKVHRSPAESVETTT